MNKTLNAGSQVSDGLSETLFSPTRRGVLALLYGHADESFYLRQLARSIGAHPSAVQREVEQLTHVGLLVKKVLGNQTYYQANSSSPVFPEIKSLMLKTAGVYDVIRQALAPLENHVRLAFVYGSVARQEESKASDLDLMVIGDVSFSEVVSRLAETQPIIRREVNPTVYSVTEFRSKLAHKNHFLQNVMKQKKLFIIRDEHELAKLASKRLVANAQK